MAQTTTPAEPDKPEQVAQGLKLVDPETASQSIKNALTLLPVINVLRAMANAETTVSILRHVHVAAVPAYGARQGAGTNDCPSRCETIRLPLCLAPERGCRTQRRSHRSTDRRS